MAGPMFSEQFRLQLTQGKYTHWATDLSEEQLRCVLWLVGEFNARAFGVMEVLRRNDRELAGASRAVLALEAMSRVVTYGERLTVNTWAQRMHLGRGHLEFGDLPQALRAALEKAAPETTWRFAMIADEGYELHGSDTREKQFSASVGNDGKVVIKTLVEESAVPQEVHAAVKKRVPAFKLLHIHARGPDRWIVDSYEFVVTTPGGKTQKLIISVNARQAPSQ